MKFWTINKFIVLALVGAFTMLLLELRFQHQAVLGEYTIAWTPIIYSGVMAILSLAALFFWERGGRQILFWAFAVALIVGTVGFWQHNEEHFGQRIAGVFTVWGNSASEHHSDEADNKEHSTNEDNKEHSANEDNKEHSTNEDNKEHSANEDNKEHSANEDNKEHSANENEEHHNDEHKGKMENLLPPVFAPLTFAGLGILGMLACARRFQRENLPQV